MKNWIGAKRAGDLLLILLGVLAIFDVLVLVGAVPSNIVWGGQVGDAAGNLIVLELVALGVTLLFALIVAAKVGYLGGGKFPRGTRAGVWIIFAYMLLNTVGNLASGVTVEKLIFAPLTIVMALLALRLAIE